MGNIEDTFEGYLIRKIRSPWTRQQIQYRVNILLKECDPLTLHTFNRYIEKRRLENPNISSSTLNKFIQAAKRYCEWNGEEWATSLKKYHEGKNRKPTFSTDEVEAFISLPPPKRSGKYEYMHRRNTIFWKVAFFSGLRTVAEVASLTKSSVDFGNRIFILEKGEEVKTGEGRLVPIVDRLYDDLKEYVASIDTELLFPTRYKPDTPLSHAAVKKDFNWRCQQLGIKKHVTPYSTRRSFATDLRMNGVDLLTLKELLGHKKLDTTERYVQDGNIEVLRKAVRKLSYNLDYLPPKEKIKLGIEALRSFRFEEDERFDMAVIDQAISLLWKSCSSSVK